MRQNSRQDVIGDTTQSTKKPDDRRNTLPQYESQSRKVGAEIGRLHKLEGGRGRQQEHAKQR